MAAQDGRGAAPAHESAFALIIRENTTPAPFDDDLLRRTPALQLAPRAFMLELAAALQDKEVDVRPWTDAYAIKENRLSFAVCLETNMLREHVGDMANLVVQNMIHTLVAHRAVAVTQPDVCDFRNLGENALGNTAIKMKIDCYAIGAEDTLPREAAAKASVFIAENPPSYEACVLSHK